MVGLTVGNGDERTITHVGTVFRFYEELQVTAPVGVRITPLSVGANGDSTSPTQAVILVENVSYVPSGGGDITLNWTRRGVA